MKKILFVSLICVGVITTKAQTTAVDTHSGYNHGTETLKPVAQIVNNNAIIIPEELMSVKESHDFGKIPQGKPVTHVFEITNIGKSAYKLDNVVASCGCTTPQWDKEKVVSPGEKSIITVGYNAAAEGPFTKPVTITYNGTQTKVITIKGEVWKTPAASAPANSALNDFKN